MRDKVYIVWREWEWADTEEEDEILAVCASAKDAEEYIEDWSWARVQSRVAASEESLKVMQDEEQEAVKKRLYITDHKVLGNTSSASARQPIPGHVAGPMPNA